MICWCRSTLNGGGSPRKATVEICGNACLSTPSLFPFNCVDRLTSPVTLPPGLARLTANPAFTGSMDGFQIWMTPSGRSCWRSSQTASSLAVMGPDQPLERWFLRQCLSACVDHPVSYRWVLGPRGNQAPLHRHNLVTRSLPNDHRHVLRRSDAVQAGKLSSKPYIPSLEENNARSCAPKDGQINTHK